MEKINVTAAEGISTLIVREGSALPEKEPVKIDISGTISAPFLFLQKKEVQQGNCHILVDYDKMTITLNVDEKDYYGSKITGKLEISPDFKRFGINAGNYRTPVEMSEFIKMNRAFFENRTEAMGLVTKLRNFKAKIDKQVESEINLNKGDKRVLIAQAVDSNVPDSFKVKIPVFKGTDPMTIEVEVYFNPDDLTCSLVSPQANEIIEDIKRSVIKSEIDRIKGIADSIPIIEV